MNPLAVALLVFAVGLSVGALLVGVPYNSLWLLGVTAAAGSIAVQVLWPGVKR